ncbi:MAG: Hsp20/alpha crystallin family protein [Crenarchaeota archaeon]|nr:MAG: Hsp20/alpha crystallin family protein [Thermoproteota archaeon]RDJ34515.1 MAG: Hsp20/alpha crystallin family protein [Thermoproteota archaeon]RDJ34856.1 MAG: Hsp20/alpha crystallin family protein [Thermoproteota archaeon]RDJ38541.1 MAG: Hsp20/alpha crystallin family protein [Thermoproteota archaeon]
MDFVKSMTKDMMKEIGNKSREFYEFVLPPVDMMIEQDKLILQVDLPGFEKSDIKLRLNGNILSINAEKKPQEKTIEVICSQRPKIIDKKIRLPINIKEGEEKITSAKYDNGVLNITIPITKSGKDIQID